jgi:hypothetical protein
MTDPETAAQKLTRLERTIELLCAYGSAKFGDEWWPGNARNWIGEDGRELEHLLDPGCAELADEAFGPGNATRYGPSWEVASGPIDTVTGAHSAQQAATLSAAERDFEDETDRYAVPDPNPRVWVRQVKAGTYGPWQQVHLDLAAIDAAVARLRADEEES